LFIFRQETKTSCCFFGFSRPYPASRCLSQRLPQISQWQALSTVQPSPLQSGFEPTTVGCDGLTPTAFGYSIDNSSSTLTKGVTVNDIDVTTAMAAGSRTVHFKSWTSNGICPVVSTNFKVAGGAAFSF
jgi:hypothetical protein